MKLKELKHNHSLTDLLKILIFSLLMLAPILSIATRCLYVVCNKNAYESYYGETINEKQFTPVGTINNVVLESQEYNLKTTVQESTFTFATLVWTVDNFSSPNSTYNKNYNTITFYMSGESPLISLTGNGNNASYINVKNATLNANFTITNINGGTNSIIYSQWLNKVTYNKYSYLDNVFEYSVHALEDNQLFNWTKNTAVYTGVNAMTSNLQIEGSVIPILITYWFLLTIIYVIIDIVLKLFTILTHMIGNKTA